jgi:hypothetical protein
MIVFRDLRGRAKASDDVIHHHLKFYTTTELSTKRKWRVRCVRLC